MNMIGSKDIVFTCRTDWRMDGWPAFLGPTQILVPEDNKDIF